MKRRVKENRCQFTFDPTVWEETTGIHSSLTADELAADGLWYCPHQARDDSELCLFHTDPDDKTDEEVRSELQRQIAKPGRESKQFIGASFGSLSLPHAIVESADNHPVDLRHSTFSGQVNLEYAVVRQPLRLESVIFEDTASFTETRFENEVYLSRGEFRDHARFIEARFEQGGWCYDVDFDDDADFSMARFGGRADFTQASFQRVHFRNVVFDKFVEFADAEFGHAMFFGGEFGGGAAFDEASFPRYADFRNVDVNKRLSISEPVIRSDVSCLDFGGATLRDGSLLQPVEGTLVYDLLDTTIGDVTIIADSAVTDVFSRLRIQNTTFEGFDFARYREELHTADWAIHEIAHDEVLKTDDGVETSAATLENTYLKAKNGANVIGDTKAAAEFFRKEMLYRRYQYVPQMKDAEASWRSRLRAGWRWSANALLSLTSGYGERPSRVVVSSIGTVLAFAGVFAVYKPAQPYGTPLGYLILSLEAFITLVLGGAERIDNPWLRLLAEVEGFIGVFLIALFVFTLTRSIHR